MNDLTHSKELLRLEDRCKELQELYALTKFAHDTLAKHWETFSKSLSDDLAERIKVSRQEFVASERTNDEAKGKMIAYQSILDYLQNFSLDENAS